MSGLRVPTDESPPEDHERHAPISDAQLDKIVDRAVAKVFDKIYAEVGKSVLRKLALLAGATLLGTTIWLAGKDALPK